MDAVSPAPWPEEDEVGEEEEGDDLITKKLVFDGLETPLKPEINRTSKKQSVLVFLRVRPKNQREVMSMDASCLHIVSQRELQAVAPETSQTFKNKAGVRCPADSSQLFTFTHIFDEQATQRDVFEESMLPTLRDFFGGQNCLVFTYGVTNSGKTYTVTGTVTEPGILPRSLDLIFNSLSPQQLSSLKLRPKNFSEAVYLTEEELERELARKEDIFNKARGLSVSEVNGMEVTVDLTTDGSDISLLSKVSSNYSKVSEAGVSVCEMQVQDGSTIELEGTSNVCYSMWVSFAEIYNELIYDLLAEEEGHGGTRRSRPSLKLAEDRNHNHFIKGLVEVKVSGVEEAMLLLKMGLQNRHVASTRLNYQSSRSHTIFTIKMMKVASSAERPHNAFVNRISIVDLAGAERSKETGARGLRVREAGNINNSLLTLGKCIEAMRHNQNKRRGEDHMVPFRESKLTRLFQNYFVGKGKGVRQGRITMLVNVSSSASVFDETAHVLRFSAITSKIIPVVKTPPQHKTPRPPLTSQRPTLPPPEETPRPSKSCRIVTADEEWTIEAKKTVSVVAVCETCESTRAECVELRKRIRSLELEKMETEYRIRQEVCREFQEQLTEIEETHRAELEEQAEDMQVAYEKRMKLLQKSMKKQLGRKRCRVEQAEEEEEEESVTGRKKGGAAETLLRERIAELEEQLQTEKERGVAVSAELRDALETHESRVVSLNQQVNCLSLKLTEAERRERQLREELASATTDVQAAEVRGKEREGELLSNCENLQRQLDMANAKVLEVTKECEHTRDERLSLISEYEEREGSLRDEIATLKSELLPTTEAVTDLTARLVCVQSEMESVSREAADSVQRAEASREDASAEVEILQARISELTQEANDPQPPPDTAVGEITCLQDQVHELQAELAKKDSSITLLRADHTAEAGKIRERVQSFLDEVVCVRCDLRSSREEVSEGYLRHSQELKRVIRSEADRQETFRCKVDTLRSQLTARQEAVCRLELQLKEREVEAEEKLSATQAEVQVLHQQLTERDGTISSLNEALQEVETARQTQTTRMSDMSSELEDMHTSSEALEQRVTSVEAKLCDSEAERTRLSTLVETLRAQTEERDQALVERECELKSSEQCRTSLERQLSELKMTHSTLQQELSQAMEEKMTLEAELREKNDEILALVTSASQDKMAASTLSSEVQSQKETVERLQKLQEKAEIEHRTRLQAVQDSHQVKTSALQQQIRELAEKGEALQQSMQDDEVVQSITQEDREGSPSKPLPRSESKPYVAVLDRSSQLVEDTFSEEPRLVIDATPPIGKRGHRVKRQKKRSIEEVKEEEETPTKKGKYQLRNRKRHQRIPGEEENCRPSLKNIITRSTKKLTSLAIQPPSPQPVNSSVSPPVVRVTRCTAQRNKRLRKSQISGPLGLVEDNTGRAIPYKRSVKIGPRAPPLYFDHQY